MGDKRDLPVADLLFEDTVGPSPVMVERQGGKELAHRALVLSVQRIALVAVDGQDTRCSSDSCGSLCGMQPGRGR